MSRKLQSMTGSRNLKGLRLLIRIGMLEKLLKQKNILSFNELMSTPIDFSVYVMNNLKINNLAQEHLVGHAFNLLKGTCRSRLEIEYNFEECYKAVTDRLDWNNPKGKEYPFDRSKPLPLIMNEGRQVVPVDYFINNDLEYLRGESSSKKYTTSTTKTKASKYDISGIEDMVPSLWIPIKVSKHDVHSTKRIITVTKVKVMKWYNYGYLEEIEVQREDQQLYKLKEGNFPRLHLHDIEDILLLLADIRPSTGSRKLPEEAQYHQARDIQFNDGTLTYVRTVLHDIASNLRMDYLPNRRWSNLDR
ncbi:hypothetical protein Tco_0298651 [Tanacetum coccineum]